MKKRFKKLGNAIIYYSLVVVLFGMIVANCILNKGPVIVLISASFLVGLYLNKIIRTIKMIRVDKRAQKMTISIMLALGFTKEEIKKQKKEFNRSKVYILK